MPPAGILQTEMDEETLLELELQQDLERLDLDNDNFVDGDEAEINNNDIPDIHEGANGDGDLNWEGEGLPAELEEYLNTIQKQRQRFEEELEECDAVINTGLSSARGEGEMGGEKSVIPYEDWKELEEAAAQEGLTVEEYKKKLLQDIEDEPFELERMDFITDDSEFLLPESKFPEVVDSAESSIESDGLTEQPLLSLPAPITDEDIMVQKALTLAKALSAREERQMEKEREKLGDVENEGSSSIPCTDDEGSSEGQLVPVESSAAGLEGVEEDEGAVVAAAAAYDCDDHMKNPVHEQKYPAEPESEAVQLNTDGTVALIPTNPFVEFENYLREQFELAEERFRQRELQLNKELEARRAVEEKLMLATEEHKLQTLKAMQQEEQELARQKEESQKKLDVEIEEQQQKLAKDLKHHEETIATLSAQLEEDRYQLEKIERAEKERVVQKTDKAATTIQRCYKGYRVRKLYHEERKTWAEKKELRRQEKEQQRIQEIEEEIQERKDEEARKKEEARKAKEEEERKIEEERRRVEEEERKKKEEEERRRKEEEDKKIREKEEKKRKEEEQKRLKEEEERKRQEEEERKRKEEEERMKREEEESKRLEEEKKRKEEEEKLRAEEEERRKQEEQQRLEEEERKQKEDEERKAREEAGERKRKEEEEEKKRQEAEQLQTEQEEEQRSDEEKTNSPNKKAATDNAKNSSVYEGGQNVESENEHSTSPVVFTLEPMNANSLPESLEEQRLAWMKSCLPWSKLSNEPWKLKSASGGKLPRRPASVKKLTPLPDSAILEAAQVASLRQVTTVELCDLPGHSLSSLGTCVNLKHLKMTSCGLITLDNLSQCKHLQCIDVQENLIEFVDLKELSSLYTLNLSHNKLSSVHGLTGCTNLRLLDVSHNRLTKLAGLLPLRRLHTLKSSHNQLVMTSGVEQCPTIQQLDVSSNYLTALEGLGKLGLLLSLNAASNNLVQMPSLENNVLLQELVLRENSIGPDLDLSVAWLPLLSYLDLSQNVIEELTGPARGLFVLKRLDLAVNQITDISSFLPALSECPRLEDLSLLGNPVLDEENLRESVKNAIQCLVCLNGEVLRSQASVMSSTQPVTSFETMCLTQVQLHKDAKHTWQKECRSLTVPASKDSTHICDTYFRFCDKSFKLAVEHRYAHEYGELSTAKIPSVPQTPRSARPTSGRSPRVLTHTRSSAFSEPQSSVKTSDNPPCQNQEKHSPVLTPRASAEREKVSVRKSPSPKLSEKEKFEMALRGEMTKVNAVASQETSHALAAMDSVPGASKVNPPPSEELRSAWQTSSGQSFSGAGGASDHRLQEHSQQQPLSEKEKFERALAGLPTTPLPLPPVGVTVQQDVSGQSEMRSHNHSMQKRQGQGSTGVTADMVGELMKSDSTADPRAGFHSNFSDDDGDLDNFDVDNLEEMMEGLQFDIDGFLDLEQFDFDEDFLEKGWRPEDTPQLPQKIHTASSGAKPPLPPVASVHPGANHVPAPPPGRPAQAWRNTESPLSDIQSRVPPLRPPSSVASGEDSQAMPTGRSRREERLAEEWGFKDSRTAEMMMQRARKMKYNAERRKKISKLDPQQRLKLFRKLEEVRGVSSVRPPPARVLPRKEYFQAQEEEAQQKVMEKQMEYKTKAGRTFEWLHTQVGDYNVSSSRINPGPPGGASPLMQTTSDSQLSHRPSPSPHGYSPMSADHELNSYASGQYPVRPHRHSLTGEELVMTGQGTLLPPIKTGSAPSTRSREREKMSWRTEPVEKSVGWGGGKKRHVKK